MDWLEEELKQALERKMPSADFAARVMAASQKRRWSVLRPWSVRKPWMAIAAMLLVVAGGSAEYRQYRGHQAKDRVMLALRITADKLNYIQNRTQRPPQRRNEVQQ